MKLLRKWKPRNIGIIIAMIALLAITAVANYLLGYKPTGGQGVLKDNESVQEGTNEDTGESIAQSPEPSPEAVPENIRVLIRTGKYESLLHNEIQITSADSFLLSWNGREQLFSGDAILTIRPDDVRLLNGSIVVTGGAGLQLVSVERDCGYPIYPGSMEISLHDGKLSIVNDVPLEDYLCLVVPGEMPVSYGLEALKVQAVCARSYAYCQMQTMSYEKYGAYVDDSTNYQVYNNQKSSELANQAVAETYGQVVAYNEEVINTYYFATSCGSTTDMDIWQSDPVSCPYFPAASLSENREVLNLQDEETFRSFIDWYTDSYDQESSFYRWQVTLGIEELTTSINTYLTNAGMASVGTVTSIEVSERGAGGIIRSLTVTGTEGKAVIAKQGAVRQAIGNSAMVIQQSNGNTVSGWEMLPSAFAYFQEVVTEGALTGYEIHGGGFGHGVGMSQSGVSGMVKSGNTYENILSYFYQGTSIQNIY